MKQVSFGFLKDYQKEFGGALLEGKRKTKRPLSTKHPLHLIRRKDYNKFIRSLTAILAKRIRKLKPHLEVIFDLRPFTRIMSWGRDFKRGLDYVILNQMEALGFIVREKERRGLRQP